jgi:5-formyltetrahydrofolate cyclo-ligase
MISADKGELRRAARARRRALQAVAPDAGVLAAERFPADAPGPFRTAALYWPTASEIDPRPLGRRLADAGARLCLPTVAAAGQALDFRLWAEDDVLAPDALGLAAPVSDAELITPELVIVPLLAFDGQGGRLGQGGGYYDRTLERLRAGGPVFALGLAFAGQEVERLPAEDHDQPLDAVLTETGLRLFR